MFHVVIRRSGPQWQPDKPLEEQSGWDEHATFMDGLVDAGFIVLGERRWDRDRPGAPWRRSRQLPALRVPQPAWGGRATNAHLLGTGRVAGRRVRIVSFANPSTPAWFTVWIDRATYRPLRLRMVAPAHFMTHRYLDFNRPLTIRPPR